MKDTMDYEGRLLTQRECYQIGYKHGRETGLREALAEANYDDPYSSCDCAAAIERLLEQKP